MKAVQSRALSSELVLDPRLGPKVELPSRRQRSSTRDRLGVADPLDRMLAVVTVARLALVPPLILVMASTPVATAAILTTFIALDVYDGVLGRSRGTDGPGRRALDSVVDRTAIHAVYLAAMVGGLLTPWLFAALLARDLYCGTLCWHMMRRRWVAIRADWLYRSLNLALAGWVVLAPLLSPDVAQLLCGLVLVWGIVVALDLTRGVAAVLAAPADVRGSVLDAGLLRRERRSR
jgi:phosphatidylglycerophosphate synthase